MARPNVNVVVGGVKRASSQYKTVVLKENQAFGLSSANTRYVIKFDYDLGGETITVPDGCILEFDGGSVANGTLTLKNDTIVIDALHSVSTSTTRPSIKHKGFQTFDLTLGIPLWWNGTAWVDATGNEPSNT